MFVPVTSEITLKSGMVLKEIATDNLFEVSERLSDRKEVWGEDKWAINRIAPRDFDLNSAHLELTRQELAMKYLAEVDD